MERAKLKVAHLVISLDCGGLENMVVELTNFRNNYSPDSTYIICLDSNGVLSDKVKPTNVFCVKAERKRNPWDISAVKKIKKILRLNGINILHSHNLAAMQYGVLACINNPVGHIYTQHGENKHTSGIKDKFRSIILSKFADKIVAVSYSVKKHMANSQWISQSKIDVINNGIMLPSIDELQRQIADLDIDISERDIIFGFVGRLFFIKGLDIFIPVLRDVITKSKKRIMFIIVGDGPEKDRLEKLTKKFGLNNNIKFVGFKYNPQKYLAAFDFFILVSRSEGLSLALLEAMACAKPSFVTNVGENQALTENGKYGFILPENKNKWSEFITARIDNPDAAAFMGQQASEHIKKKFSIDSTFRKYENIYNQICNIPT